MSNNKIIDGKKVAQEMREKTAARVKQIVDKTGVQPCLATVLVGSDPASEAYVNSKGRLCGKLGMGSVKVHLPEETTTEELIDKLTELATDPAIHGMLLQHPVPDQIDERAAFEAIPGAKDVDGVTYHSFGTMTFGEEGFDSCTPGGMMVLLDYYGVELKGKEAVVIGRSAILGKPMAMLMLGEHATVTICHSRTRDLPDVVRRADIVVAAVGKARFVHGDWIKPGAVVLDAGYNPGEKGLIGDVDFESAIEKASLITPVPGGVGPMTLAVLTDQTAIGAARQLGVELD